MAVEYFIYIVLVHILCDSQGLFLLSNTLYCLIHSQLYLVITRYQIGSGFSLPIGEDLVITILLFQTSSRVVVGRKAFLIDARLCTQQVNIV